MRLLALVLTIFTALGCQQKDEPSAASKTERPPTVKDQSSVNLGITEQTGKLVISPQFDRASSFSEGLAAVLIGGSWGYIDKQGKMLLTHNLFLQVPSVKV